MSSLAEHGLHLTHATSHRILDRFAAGGEGFGVLVGQDVAALQGSLADGPRGLGDPATGHGVGTDGERDCANLARRHGQGEFRRDYDAPGVEAKGCLSFRNWCFHGGLRTKATAKP